MTHQGLEVSDREPPARVVTCGKFSPLLVCLSLSLATGCGWGNAPVGSVRVRLAGAQIPLELIESWLNHDDPDRFRVERVQPVYLSQHGFEALARGACDVACADRPLAAQEVADFTNGPPHGYRVAFYGYALYVHPSNPIESIYAAHVELLFRKRIHDWKELGNSEGPITLLGPRKATRGGTILAKQANIWFASPTWTVFDSDAQVIDAVRGDPSAIGFASIGLDQGVRYLGLRMERNGPAAFPSLEEIESERYGLAKVIYAYVPSDTPALSESGGSAASETKARTPAAAVLTRLFSPAGRKAIESTSVWPVPPERAPVSIPTAPLNAAR